MYGRKCLILLLINLWVSSRSLEGFSSTWISFNLAFFFCSDELAGYLMIDYVKQLIFLIFVVFGLKVNGVYIGIVDEGIQ